MSKKLGSAGRLIIVFLFVVICVSAFYFFLYREIRILGSGKISSIVFCVNPGDQTLRVMSKVDKKERVDAVAASVNKRWPMFKLLFFDSISGPYLFLDEKGEVISCCYYKPDQKLLVRYEAQKISENEYKLGKQMYANSFGGWGVISDDIPKILNQSKNTEK